MMIFLKNWKLAINMLRFNFIIDVQIPVPLFLVIVMYSSSQEQEEHHLN